MLSGLIQHRLDIPGLPSFSMTLHPLDSDQAVSTYIYHFGCWEPFETLIFQKLIGHFSLFVDLGANIGWYTVLAEMLMADGSEVHSFEPDPDNFALLSQNANRASQVRVSLNNTAVADRIGEERLFRSPTNYGDHQLYATGEARSSVPVPMTTLDVYFGDRTLPPALVKMDTQGSELRILQGGHSVFSAASRDNAYMIEFWPYGIANAGSDIEAYVATLEQLPQTPHIVVQAAKKLKPVTWQELRQFCVEGGPLAPGTQQFVDLVMTTPGTAASEAVAEYVLSE